MMSPNVANHVSNAAYDHVNEFMGVDWTYSEIGYLIDGIWFLISQQHIGFSTADYFQQLAELGDALQP